jgi:hypothetical protein
MADAQAEKQYAQIIAKAWTDESFKRRLLEDPRAVLREHGISPPAGVEILAVESTPQRRYFIIPPRPEHDMSEEDLSQLVGGAGGACATGPTFGPTRAL